MGCHSILTLTVMNRSFFEINILILCLDMSRYIILYNQYAPKIHVIFFLLYDFSKPTDVLSPTINEILKIKYEKFKKKAYFCIYKNSVKF